MSLKKTVAIAAAVSALAAISVPAMALENEFHGMYRAYGYMTNALGGNASFNLAKDSGTDKYIEQRARLQYIAKASDDLKLVTHFELDAKFGGANTASKYVATDGGGLDADRLSLETKSVYLDFKIPSTPVRAQVGIQPYNDSFGGLFGNFDATGAVFTGKFFENALTASYGYFTVGSSSVNGVGFDAFKNGTNKYTQDLNAIDLKYALSKDLTVGASYYMLLDKNVINGTAAVAGFYTYDAVGNGTFHPPVAATSVSGSGATLVNNTVGLNAAGKMGPVSLNGAFGMQFGKSNTNAQVAGALPTTGGYTNLTNAGTTAFAASIAAKVAVGPGNVNLAALYLSGDKGTDANYNHAWQSIGAGVNYFTPANMWLLTRNAATINTSTAIGGTTDLTRGGRGIKGAFAGYDGAAGKIFYSGNVGYAAVADKRNAGSSSIGTEINATVGYKLYDNLSAGFTGAYAFLGDGYKNTQANNLQYVPAIGATAAIGQGAPKADNPFLTAIQLNYVF